VTGAACIWETAVVGDAVVLRLARDLLWERSEREPAKEELDDLRVPVD
jgi:hypothetical protein